MFEANGSNLAKRKEQRKQAALPLKDMAIQARAGRKRAADITGRGLQPGLVFIFSPEPTRAYDIATARTRQI